jgi:hypothetical protein
MKKTTNKQPDEVYIVTVDDPYMPYKSGYRLCTKQSVIQQIRHYVSENMNRLRYPDYYHGQLLSVKIHKAEIKELEDVTSEFVEKPNLRRDND